MADLLERVESQDEVERESAAAELVNKLLRERDARLTRRLKQENVSAATLRIINDSLAADRKARQAAQGEAARLELSTTARSLLHHLRNGRLEEIRATAKATVAKLKKVGLERDDLERALAVTPDEDDMAKLIERLRAADTKVNSLNEQARAQSQELDSLKEEKKRCVDKLKAVRTGEGHEEFERDDQKRMIQLTARTRDTMQVFLARATERKIERLSDLITESFRYLLQKQTMVARIAIDPATFAITLFDDAGHALPKHRLSEGEKQIFAISVLWGLGRASARPLPAVIDTPMARLDAANRRNLVERYFPHASHQVLILSTDTEVDAQAYRSLRSHIARAYHLSYDEKTRSTSGEPGYFWKEHEATTR